MRLENTGSNMTRKMKALRLPMLLVVSAAFTPSCFEPVDDQSTMRAQGWDGVSTDNVLPADREVFIDVDESVVADSPCAKTEWDLFHFGDGQEGLSPADRDPAQNGILVNHCAACHAIGGASQGATPFSFVLDAQEMVNTLWHRLGGDARFIVPGNPDESQVYYRAVTKQDMPPIYDAATGAKPLDRMSYSEASVLREWIVNCLGSDPLSGAGTTTASQATGAGAGGAGGAGTTDTGGAAGAGGAN